jgi:IS1 family transposase
MNYFYLLTAVLGETLIALVFTIRNYQTTNAIEVVSKFTSTICNADKSCVTTICINDEPCRSITSNSSSIRQDNSTEENKIKSRHPIFLFGLFDNVSSINANRLIFELPQKPKHYLTNSKSILVPTLTLCL